MTRAAAAAVAAVAVFAGFASAAVEQSRFRFARTLEARPGAVSFQPDGPMYEHAQPEFADLRVLDARGREVPWRADPEPPVGTFRPLRLLNRGRTQDGNAVALFDLGPRRRFHDRIELSIPGGGFVARASVFGSDDRERPLEAWPLLGTTVVYDVAGAQRARSTTVVYPVSDFRYLYVRVRGVGAITGGRVESALERPVQQVERTPARTERRDLERRTVFRIDFGHRNVPVDEVHVLARGRYVRPVIVEGSNDGRRFEPLGYGRIARYPPEPGVPPRDVPARIAVGARHRYLRLTIENGDDEPLRGYRLGFVAEPEPLLLSDGFRPPYRLLYGSRRLAPPVYDFAAVPAASIPPATVGRLGPERANPAFEVPGADRSFVERHDWLVEASLALAALVVGLSGFLALRRRA